jgi:YndJ-like protein/uncharacterized protein DUF1990
MRHPPLDQPRHSFASSDWIRVALAGCGAWIAGVACIRPGLAESLLLLGPLVAVPLGFASVDEPPARCAGLRRLVLLSCLAGALCLLASFAFPTGNRAALLALPWLLFTALVGVLGLRRLVERGPLPMAELAIDGGMLFLPVGGTWVLFSRWGERFLGFGEPLVLLTGAHFHFAGFVLPILTGLAARALPGFWGRIAAAGVLSGVPLVAAGITLTPRGIRWVEPIAAVWLTSAAFIVAGLQWRLVAAARSTDGAFLLGVSGTSLAAAMALAPVYALGLFLGRPWLDIPAMLRLHAAVNVFGFALPGLLYWCRRGSRPSDLEDWERREVPESVAAGPGPRDARDEHVREIGVEEPGAPETSGTHRRGAESVLRFEVFPAGILTPVLRRAPVRAGDTIGARYHFAPGLDIFFATRVTEVFDGPDGGVWRTGFTCRTLEGHPFTGEETFAIEKDMATGSVRAVVRSWSRPAQFFVRLARPIARRIQLRAAREAMRHIERRSSISRPAGPFSPPHPSRAPG